MQVLTDEQENVRRWNEIMERTSISKYPPATHVAAVAYEAVIKAMAPVTELGTGSDKSGPGDWYTKDLVDDPYYHLNRIVTHGQRAESCKAGTLKDSEGVVGHLRRAICRAAMQLVIELERKG